MDGSQSRWARRPALAKLLRAAVFAAPVLTSFVAAWGVRTALPQPQGTAGRLASLGLLVVVSTLVLVAVDRLSRRAVPLATLLDLSMLFPDRAPSRLGVAREAIRRRPIEEQLRRVREAGADPGAVAREILTLVAALSSHDRPTRGHAERVRMFTDLLAQQLRVPSRDRDLLRWAAILHDIGKLRVPASLLNKPGKPTPEEWEVLKSHPAHGAEMAGPLLPWLGEWGDVIVQHHERYDGTGYPTGIAGRDISLGARIVSVADAYDVMTAARAYKRPVSRAAALQELVRFSGTQFDPTVVRAMVDVGAPRLRRAQGVLAWLADVPLVATGSVPVATVARVVGAGALATGAIAGGVTASDSLGTPRAWAATAPAAGESRDADTAGTAPGASSALPSPGAPTTSDASDPVDLADPGAAADPGSSGDPATGPNGPGTAGGPDRSGGGEGTPDITPEPTASPTGRGPSKPEPTDSPTTGSPTDPLDPVVDPVTDKVTDTVTDPVGTVTDTVTGTVTDPVGTVTGTVTDPVGTVTGTAGGLLGSGSPAPSPTSSPTSVVGGLLGR